MNKAEAAAPQNILGWGVGAAVDEHTGQRGSRFGVGVSNGG